MMNRFCPSFWRLRWYWQRLSPQAQPYRLLALHRPRTAPKHRPARPWYWTDSRVCELADWASSPRRRLPYG